MMAKEYPNTLWNIALKRAAKIAREHKSGPEYGRPYIMAQNEACDQIAKLILLQRRSFATTGTAGMDDAIRFFFDYGCQYYVTGRYAAFAGLTPAVGNLLHHAIEMFVKGSLSKSMTLDDMRQKLGHDLVAAWKALKAQANDATLATFDKTIEALNDFEDIRYPDEILKKGAQQRVDIVKSDVTMTAGAGQQLPEYRLCLQDIDELVEKLFKIASRNPVVYLRFIKNEANDYVKRENSFKFE
jgi:hypothetical protein